MFLLSGVPPFSSSFTFGLCILMRVRLDLVDGNQRQVQSPNHEQDASQCCLFDDGAGEDGAAVTFVRDGQALKPVGPLFIQMASDANFIVGRPVVFFGLGIGITQSVPRKIRRSSFRDSVSYFF